MIKKKTSIKFKNKYRIPSNRLDVWDYSRKGAYFITICTKDREHHFGGILNCQFQQTEASRIANECWSSLPNFYPNIKLDEFVIMPNHVHFVILITDDSCVDNDYVSVNKSLSYRMKRRKMLLSKIIGRFKMQTAKQINIISNCQGRPFWQRNYYDHIVRNEPELGRIRKYIRYNPLRWEKDRNNPPGIFI